YIASCPTRRPSDLLQPRRGQDHHRSLAAILQHQEATLVAWIQATGTRGHHLACASKRSSTVICPGNSPKADHELRLKPDHPMGSGHVSTARIRQIGEVNETQLMQTGRISRSVVVHEGVDNLLTSYINGNLNLLMIEQTAKKRGFFS